MYIGIFFKNFRIFTTCFTKVYKNHKNPDTKIRSPHLKINCNGINTGMKNKTTELLKSQDSYNIRLSDGFYEGK